MRIGSKNIPVGAILVSVVFTAAMALFVSTLPQQIALSCVALVVLLLAIIVGWDAHRHRISTTKAPYALNTGAIAWAGTILVFPFIGSVAGFLIGFLVLGATGASTCGTPGMVILLAATVGRYVWKRSQLNLQPESQPVPSGTGRSPLLVVAIVIGGLALLLVGGVAVVIAAAVLNRLPIQPQPTATEVKPISRHVLPVSTTESAGVEKQGPFVPSSSAVRPEATLQAWNALQQANYQFSTQGNLMPAPRCQQLAQQYALVNPIGVDPSLQGYVRDSVAVFRKLASQFEAIDARLVQMYGQAQALQQLGAVVGSSARDYNNPQGNPEAGAFVFGILGAAAVQQKASQSEPEYKAAVEAAKVEEILKRGEALRAELSQRYGFQFVELW